MYFNSNDYPLSKEYQNRMQHKIDVAQLVDDQHPDQSIKQMIMAHHPVRIIVFALVVIGLFMMTGQDVSAQESPGFDPGVASESLTDTFNMGVYYLHQGQFTEAVSEFTTVVEKDPEFGAAFAARGVAYHSMGMFPEAIADYTSAISIFPEYASAYNFRGLAHLEQGEYDEALADSHYAAELDATYANPHLTMGEVYMAMEDYEAALESYELYVELAGTEATSVVFDQIAVCQEELDV